MKYVSSNRERKDVNQQESPAGLLGGVYGPAALFDGDEDFEVVGVIEDMPETLEDLLSPDEMEQLLAGWDTDEFLRTGRLDFKH